MHRPCTEQNGDCASTEPQPSGLAPVISIVSHPPLFPPLPHPHPIPCQYNAMSVLRSVPILSGFILFTLNLLYMELSVVWLLG